MTQRIRDFMTSNPCTIDADKSVAYAAKMMRDEDVGLAPIVEGNKLIGMLTDRDIAVRVAAQGRNPDQVKVREVASTKLVAIDPQQDLDEALRIMAKHQVRRLPVVQEDGRLVGVVAQADIAREGDATRTGQLVEEISESGGQMSGYEEQFPSQVTPQVVEPVTPEEEEREEVGISRVASTSRGRRRRASTSRARSTARRKSTGARKKSTARKTTRRKTTARKTTTSRKRAAAGRKGGRKTAARKTTARKTTRRRTTRRKTTARKTTRRKTTARRAPSRVAARKGGRKTAARKTTARKTTRRKTTRRKTTSRKSTARKTTRRKSTGRTTARATGRKTTRRRTTRRKSTS